MEAHTAAAKLKLHSPSPRPAKPLTAAAWDGALESNHSQLPAPAPSPTRQAKGYTGGKAGTSSTHSSKSTLAAQRGAGFYGIYLILKRVVKGLLHVSYHQDLVTSSFLGQIFSGC